MRARETEGTESAERLHEADSVIYGLKLLCSKEKERVKYLNRISKTWLEFLIKIEMQWFIKLEGSLPVTFEVYDNLVVELNSVQGKNWIIFTNHGLTV